MNATLNNQKQALRVSEKNFIFATPNLAADRAHLMAELKPQSEINILPETQSEVGPVTTLVLTALAKHQAKFYGRKIPIQQNG